MFLGLLKPLLITILTESRAPLSSTRLTWVIDSRNPLQGVGDFQVPAPWLLPEAPKSMQIDGLLSNNHPEVDGIWSVFREHILVLSKTIFYLLQDGCMFKFLGHYSTYFWGLGTAELY